MPTGKLKRTEILWDLASAGAESHRWGCRRTSEAKSGKPGNVNGFPIFMEVLRMVCFIIGFFIGGIVGFMVTALMIASGDRGDDNGKWS